MNEKNLKITPEEEAELRALRGYSPKHIFYWVHPLEKKCLPKEKWSVWKLESRNSKDIADVEDQMFMQRTPDGKTRTSLSNARIDTLYRHVKGFKNYFGKDDKEIVCEYEDEEKTQVTRESIHSISKDLQIDLLDAINNEDKLTEEEKLGLEF